MLEGKGQSQEAKREGYIFEDGAQESGGADGRVRRRVRRPERGAPLGNRRRESRVESKAAKLNADEAEGGRRLDAGVVKRQ